MGKAVKTQESNSKLRVAVIGAGGFGAMTLGALKQCDCVEVVGVSDKNASAAQTAAKSAGVEAFNDNRALLAQTKPAAVFLAAPPAACMEMIGACADRGIHVWKEMPLARNLQEGLAMVRRMEAAKLKFVVGTQRRFAAGYRRAFELRGKVGQVFLARSHYLFNWGPNLLWRGDKASAGGGALLDLAYHPIDLLVWLLGMPEDVYGVCAQGRDKKGPDGKKIPIYDTEDTAAAIMRYGKEGVATVVTTRSSGPVSEELSLHGQKGALVANCEACTLRDRDGNVLDRVNAETDRMAVFVHQIRAFVKAVIDKTATYECSARENLLNLAVIEAIYLSDRTAQPENPRRILKNNGLTVNDCLEFRPEEQQ